MHRLISFSCGMLLTASAAIAGPINPNHVAAEARWLVHVDVQGFVDSAVGKCMLEHHGGEGMEGIEEIKEALGVDVLHDVFGITLYGTVEEGEMGVDIDEDEVRIGASLESQDNAVAVIVMNGAVDEMIERLKQDESYAEVRKDGIVLHSFIEPESGERHLVYTKQGDKPSERLVVAGHNIETVVHAVSVVNGGAANLTNGDRQLTNVTSPHQGSLIFGTATKLDGWGDDNPASQILNKSTQILVDFGENAGEAFAVMAVSANTEKDAENISQILQGLVALGRMVLAEEEDAEQLLHMLGAVKFQSHENNIVALLKMSTDEACEMIKQAAEHQGHDFDDDHDDDDDHEDNHHHMHGD